MLAALPRTKAHVGQLWLFDKPLRGHADARNVLGDFVEHLTARLFRGRRFVTDSTKAYCPDVQVKNLFLECKACGRSRQTFIYAGRLAKDRAFAMNNRLAYCIWHHAACTKIAASQDELRALFLANLKAVYIVPFEHINLLLVGKPIEKLNSKYGGTDRATYGSGFRINISEFANFRIPVRFDRELF